MATENERRIKRETLIARKAVRCLLDAGYSVGVYDGEATALKPTTDRRAIYNAMASTDEDWLLADRNGQEAGWVRLIYGNDTDLISDYTVSLEDAIKPACEYAEKL